MIIPRIFRSTFSVVLLCIIGSGAAFAAVGLLMTGPNPNAQVGVPYSSAFVTSGGVPPYGAYAVFNGTLPPGLNLNSNSGAITGTPTTAGVYTFSAGVADQSGLPTDSLTAARRRGTAQSGNREIVGFFGPFSVTVAPAAPSPTPVPPSVWMAMTGLVGAGMLGLRKRRP